MGDNDERRSLWEKTTAPAMPNCPLKIASIGATPAAKWVCSSADAYFLEYIDSRNPVPTQQLRRRPALAPLFNERNGYEATMHRNGQRTAVLDDDHAASGVAYCLAHHVKVDIAAHPDDRGDPLRRHVYQTRRHVSFQPTPTHGRPDRNPHAGNQLRPVAIGLAVNSMLGELWERAT
jgi:hypothetical protein